MCVLLFTDEMLQREQNDRRWCRWSPLSITHLPYSTLIFYQHIIAGGALAFGEAGLFCGIGSARAGAFVYSDVTLMTVRKGCGKRKMHKFGFPFFIAARVLCEK